MGTYSAKHIDYGYKEKVCLYRFPMEYGENCKNKSNMKREKYADMCDEKKICSDKRRIRYYKKKVADLTEIALMNTDLNVVITLTFRESVTSYDYALAEWQLFLKRLRHLYTDPLKYICVWEYQKKRSQDEGIKEGGIYHFHCLMNIGFIKHESLEKIWGNGFVWIDKIHNGNRLKTIRYTLKYITKEVVENSNERGKRYIFSSNNLIKPTISLLTDSKGKEEILFEQMENVICDGDYYIRNADGEIINHVDYIEYKK